MTFYILKKNFIYLFFLVLTITSWQIHGVTVEIVADFIFLGSKITVHGDCSHEIKTYSLGVKL